jgi:aminoglycoside phosphotransferase (APT) family kinase protein
MIDTIDWALAHCAIVRDPGKLLTPFLIDQGITRVLRFHGGSRNPTYICFCDSDACVLRTVPNINKWQIKKEVYIYKTIQHVPVPKVLSESDYSFVMSYCGPSADLTSAIATSFYTSCGNILRRLHEESLDITKLNQARHCLAEWDSLFEYNLRMRQCQRWLSRTPTDSPLRPLLSSLLEKIESMDDVIDAFKASRFCFTHSDFRLGNILTDGIGVTGIIDFEHAIFGDPDHDLHTISQQMVDREFPIEYIRLFLSAYVLPSTFQPKKRFYRYYRAFQRSAMTAREKIDVQFLDWIQMIIDGSDSYLRADLR